ncbi:histidine phosphatase family protein [Arenimonas daejeonensis]|uniref:histidine phosphatase family protein n=1 Tax=Arenimonas daejeonensis TaxID=370777 RepID=UPI0011BF2E4D|nr:histidine phosphatase family protein [Arenimonas daejeonensis]
MSLLLVRHGQASYGAADYDNLSERGQLQSRRLGEWLVRGGHRFKAVVVGGMRRHRQTADGIVAAFAAQGLELPEPVADEGFAEFDHQAVFGAWLSRYADHPVAIASRSGNPRDVGAMLQAALLAWARDELPGLPESWAAFGTRVQSAGQRLEALAGDGEALVLSSGGVISRLAQMALDVPDHRAVELNLALRNSALSEFHPHGGRLRLGSWNALPHLHGERELWTYY